MASKWSRGVQEYERELKSQFRENFPKGTKVTKEKLLNGARDWKEYSYGGNSLIYNQDIAERLATPSELKKTKSGLKRPNSQEEWLDVQARALYQASRNILNNLKKNKF